MVTQNGFQARPPPHPDPVQRVISPTWTLEQRRHQLKARPVARQQSLLPSGIWVCWLWKCVASIGWLVLSMLIRLHRWSTDIIWDPMGDFVRQATSFDDFWLSSMSLLDHLRFVPTWQWYMFCVGSRIVAVEASLLTSPVSTSGLSPLLISGQYWSIVVDSSFLLWYILRSAQVICRHWLHLQCPRQLGQYCWTSVTSISVLPTISDITTWFGMPLGLGSLILWWLSQINSSVVVGSLQWWCTLGITSPLDWLFFSGIYWCSVFWWDWALTALMVDCRHAPPMVAPYAYSQCWLLPPAPANRLGDTGPRPHRVCNMPSVPTIWNLVTDLIWLLLYYMVYFITHRCGLPDLGKNQTRSHRPRFWIYEEHA